MWNLSTAQHKAAGCTGNHADLQRAASLSLSAVARTLAAGRLLYEAPAFSDLYTSKRLHDSATRLAKRSASGRTRFGSEEGAFEQKDS